MFTARRLPGTCVALGKYLLNDRLGTSQAMGLHLPTNEVGINKAALFNLKLPQWDTGCTKVLFKCVKGKDWRRTIYYDLCPSLTLEGPLQMPPWLPSSHPQLPSGCSKPLRRKPQNDHSDFHFHFVQRRGVGVGEEICYLALSRPCDFKKFISRYRERNATSWSFVL